MIRHLHKTFKHCSAFDSEWILQKRDYMLTAARHLFGGGVKGVMKLDTSKDKIPL
jgi:hypothetical protein